MFKSNTYSKSLGSLEILVTFTSALFSWVSSPADVKQMYVALSEFRMLVRDSGFYGILLTRFVCSLCKPKCGGRAISPWGALREGT
jgi:hypothetical protein